MHNNFKKNMFHFYIFDFLYSHCSEEFVLRLFPSIRAQFFIKNLNLKLNPPPGILQTECPLLLNHDLLLNIINFLSYHDKNSFSRTCKFVYSVCQFYDLPQERTDFFLRCLKLIDPKTRVLRPEKFFMERPNKMIIRSLKVLNSKLQEPDHKNFLEADFIKQVSLFKNNIDILLQEIYINFKRRHDNHHKFDPAMGVYFMLAFLGASPLLCMLLLFGMHPTDASLNTTGIVLVFFYSLCWFPFISKISHFSIDKSVSFILEKYNTSEPKALSRLAQHCFWKEEFKMDSQKISNEKIALLSPDNKPTFAHTANIV